MHGAHFSREELNQKTGQIVDAAIKVHTCLGPGLLESAYQTCLAHELRRRARKFRVGLLFNFNEPHLRNGIRRRVNAF